VIKTGSEESKEVDVDDDLKILESDINFEEVRDDEDTNKHVEDEGQESEYKCCSGDDNRGMDKRTCNICFRMFYSMGNMRAMLSIIMKGREDWFVISE
jgi:hypothetical protein